MKRIISAAARITAVLLVLVFAFAAVGCGKIADALPSLEQIFGQGSDILGKIDIDVDMNEFLGNLELPNAEETTMPNIATIDLEALFGQTEIVYAETTAEATTVPPVVEIPVITEAPVAVTEDPFWVTQDGPVTGYCDHEHYTGEALKYYKDRGIAVDSDTQYRLYNERLVIAYGGLRLRNRPSKDGTQVGLLPDGVIVDIIARQDGWAYVAYDGDEGWCSMEYMFEPFTNPTKGKSPIAVGNVTARSGVELFIINRHCSKKDAVSTIIPRNTQVYIYDIGGGTAYVSYKGTIYGRCAVEDLDITYYTTW